jgi:hypothetical protein
MTGNEPMPARSTAAMLSLTLAASGSLAAVSFVATVDASVRQALPREAVAERAANAGPIGLPDVEGGYATTHLLVRWKAGVRPTGDGKATIGLEPRARRGSLAASITEANRLLAGAGAIGVRAQFPNLRDRATAARLGLDRVYRIELPIGSDTPALAAALRALGGIVESVELDGIGGLAGVPNDPEFIQQFAMHNIGQTVNGVPGTPDADIDAPEAWDLVAERNIDTSTVTIAVLDSGVNAHAQLAGRILPGFNIPDNSTITVDECQSHGTHVSGIIAATGNDGAGTAGLAWQARIVPYVVVNPCTGFESSVATALTMATDAGHRVASMSLQFYAGTQTLRDAVLYAAANDVIMIAAAGNNNNGAIAFPGRWPEVICVASVTNTDAKSNFSNFGPEVDLAAGGTDIRSLVGTSTYGFKSGTSQATPSVTGTIALMLAWNPTLSAGEVRDILTGTAVDIGAPGFDPITGFGRVNAHAALLATPNPLPADLNNDGSVGPNDLAILLDFWGACADCDGACVADLDGDCLVGPTDLAILLGSWG